MTSSQPDHSRLPSAIGFDIGGTNLRAAVVAGDGTIVDRIQTSSDGSVADLERSIVATARQLQEQHPDVAAVGLAVAAFLDQDRQRVRFAPHLPWRDADVAQRIGEQLSIPVQLEHDANSAAWGEYQFGAAQGVSNWVLVSLGTGIGGAMMQHNGEIYRGAFGTAPEFGHLSVVHNGRPCSCGKRGCWERYCSGTALVATGIELARTGRFKEPIVRELLTGNPTGTDVMLAARNGSDLALEAVADFAAWLGRGLALVVDVFDPELLVIGGGVAQAADQYMDTAHQVFVENITGSGYRPLADIQLATLGTDAGLIGAANIAARYVAS